MALEEGGVTRLVHPVGVLGDVVVEDDSGGHDGREKETGGIVQVPDATVELPELSAGERKQVVSLGVGALALDHPPGARIPHTARESVSLSHP
jgi:hypothetical protein